VPSAILFDLANDGCKAWGETPPYRRLATEALAAVGPAVVRGNVGAGYGATCGALKGGVGTASIRRHTDGHPHETVAALIAVNAFGDAVVPGGTRLWAAPFELGAEMGNQTALPGIPLHAPSYTEGKPLDGTETPSNTTIGVIATDVALSRSEALRVAMMAHDGLARAIRPIHTPFDGDTLFVLSTSKKQLAADELPARARLITRLGSMAADVTTRAVGNGMVSAQSLGGWTSYRDWLARQGGSNMHHLF
jgi:L-aminopeptidase/D-esterase-like protein